MFVKLRYIFSLPPRNATYSQVIQRLTYELWASISVLSAGMCLQRSVMPHRSARSMWVYRSLLSPVQARPRKRRPNRKRYKGASRHRRARLFFARMCGRTSHGRDRTRGEQLLNKIRAADRGSAVLLPADFSSLAEVRRLARAIRQ
jgi:hypothetical protein